MAKKTRDQAPRKASKAVADLEKDADALRKLVGQLRARAREMRAHNLKSIEIDGINKIGEGTQTIRDFCGALWLALHKAGIDPGPLTVDDLAE